MTFLLAALLFAVDGHAGTPQLFLDPGTDLSRPASRPGRSRSRRSPR
ncbi:MAG TPA: hypothetical protein VMK66_16740 [Myxococcales bacterium]|nr:hypothetical protein [Myxococcales bacterium]